MNTETPIRLWRIPQSIASDHAKLAPQLAQTQQQLKQIAQRFDRITLANSLAVEDLVLVDLMAKLQLNIDVFVLNTGKLHEQSVAYLTQIRDRYSSLRFSVFEPLEHELDAFSSNYDFSDIYASLTARQACCQTRKIEPLQRALSGYEAWITGQRREQASTRRELPAEEFDANHGLYKFNPLAAWTQSELWAYVQQHGLAINPLYQQGMPSIGCEPCTKAIRQHEDLRAGRWWWEQQQSKECGLHLNTPTSSNSLT